MVSTMVVGDSDASANGGSMKTISNTPVADESHCKLSAAITVAPSADNNCLASCRHRTAWALRSNKTQTPAPRDNASNPNAPLPANRSRQRAAGNTGISQLNSVSRIRSPVGRRPSPSGKCSLRPRQRPPMIRTRLSRCTCVLEDRVGGCLRKGNSY